MSVAKDSKLEQVKDFESFEARFEEITEKYQVNPDKEDETQVRDMALKITNKLSNIANRNFDQTFIGICALMQCGAHLKGVQNRTIKIDDYEFSKRELIFASEQAKNTYTLRKIARSIKEYIAKVAIKYKIPGHLYKKFRTKNPQFEPLKNPQETMYISAYCTDFQYDNPKAPLIVREFLSKRLDEK